MNVFEKLDLPVTIEESIVNPLYWSETRKIFLISPNCYNIHNMCEGTLYLEDDFTYIFKENGQVHRYSQKVSNHRSITNERELYELFKKTGSYKLAFNMLIL